MAYTPLGRLMLEALVLAAAFAVLFLAVHAGAMALAGRAAMTHHGLLVAQAALSAALFHVGCEYAGVNAWYCKNRK